uniref:Lens intrinsic membrane protein 2 n=1 Tax=Amphilophus citrinellus TaxID=61819 RepID=A0A3Q0SIU8_AMPCI
MYSFMGGGLFCAGVRNILLIVSTATIYWMQYWQSTNYMHQGLWRYCMLGKCFPQNDTIYATRVLMILSLLACFISIIIAHSNNFAYFYNLLKKNYLFIYSFFFLHFPLPFHFPFLHSFLVFLAMSVYAGVTINYYAKCHGNWRFSWSYIIGWVSVVLTFHTELILHPCAKENKNCRV